MKRGKKTTLTMVNLFVVRASARIRGTEYGLKAALRTPRFIRLKCYHPSGLGLPKARLRGLSAGLCSQS